MNIRHHRPALLATAILGAFSAQAKAEDNNTSSFISDGKVSGYVRAYEFSNRNFYNSPVDNDTFVLGGKLKAESGEVNHFSVAAAFYTAHTPQSTSDTSMNYDPTLGTDIDTLGEAYLNYRNEGFNLRAGRQVIETPFANSADYRMVPALYQGVTADYNPTKSYGFTAGRITHYKSWTSSSFGMTNNETDGPFKKPGLDGLTSSGFWYAGAHALTDVRGAQLTSQLWYYNFINVANLIFLDEKLAFPVSEDFKPFVGFQYAHQKETGSAILGAVDSTPYGFKFGADFGQSNVTAAVVHIPSHQGAFNNGGMASPYTDGYGSASLFTANMLFPTEGLGSGDAYQLSGSHTFNESWSTWASYNRFNQTADGSPAETIDEYVLSVTYTPAAVKGLQITNMLGYATMENNSNNFLQNRLMLQYNF
ncbi:MAG: OprD family outer membrane porin [Rhodocyclaceae bacterium]|nr:OprD family outer membrane porin [Rhodocyclaceae bacterium]